MDVFWTGLEFLLLTVAAVIVCDAGPYAQMRRYRRWRSPEGRDEAIGICSGFMHG